MNGGPGGWWRFLGKEIIASSETVWSCWKSWEGRVGQGGGGCLVVGVVGGPWVDGPMVGGWVGQTMVWVGVEAVVGRGVDGALVRWGIWQGIVAGWVGLIWVVRTLLLVRVPTPRLLDVLRFWLDWWRQQLEQGVVLALHLLQLLAHVVVP